MSQQRKHEGSYCDCWTDAAGYWRLGSHCAELEREAWREAMEHARTIVDALRDERGLPRRMNGRKIDDVELPEDRET